MKSTTRFWILFVMSLTLPHLSHTQRLDQAQPLEGISFFSPRSQSVNAARDLVGWHPHIHRFDMKKTYATFTVMPSYTHSVRDRRIAQALFGTDTLFISGSLINNRGTNDILADYFGLSPTFQSTVRLRPRLQNAMAVFYGYLGLDSLLEGLYVRFAAPAVWTKWDFKLEEEIFNDGSGTPFPPRYMTDNALVAPVSSFKNAIKGGITFGDMQEGLAAGKIDGARSKGGISDVQCVIGWDPLIRENGHAGFNLRVAAPTGSRPTSEFLFEPLIGNGKHWELGVGFTGHVVIWEKDGDQELTVHAEANVTHLFGARQKRSFDLIGTDKQAESQNFANKRFGSRYILLKIFDENGNYTGKLAPTINKTTLSCDVSMDVQFDFVLMFGYTHKGIVFDIGYNGWLRSKEKISLKETLPEKRFALKGIQDVRDAAGNNSNATQSTATLHGNNLSQQAAVIDIPSPVFFSTDDLDLRSAGSPRVITHKFFTHLGYTWVDRPENEVEPFIGFGGELEFEGINTRNTPQEDSNTLSQFGVWLQVGLAF